MKLQHISYVGRLTSALSILNYTNASVIITEDDKLKFTSEKDTYLFDNEHALLVWLWEKISEVAEMESTWLKGHSPE